MGPLWCSRATIRTEMSSRFCRISSNNTVLQVLHPCPHHKLGKFHFPWVHEARDPFFKTIIIYRKCKRSQDWISSRKIFCSSSCCSNCCKGRTPCSCKTETRSYKTWFINIDWGNSSINFSNLCHRCREPSYSSSSSSNNSNNSNSKCIWGSKCNNRPCNQHLP